METKFKIQYERNDRYPGKGTIESYLARHHIISYPFMAVYTIVAARYCAMHAESWKEFRRFFTEREINADQMLDYFRDNLDDEYVYLVMSNYGKNLPGCGKHNACIGHMRRVCWAESNLFIGPASVYRTNDPSQKLEQFPISMQVDSKTKKQMRLAKEVSEAWQRISSACIVGEKDQFIEFTLKNSDGKEVEKFVVAFLAYINCTKDIYVTGYDDWAAVPIGEKGSYTFRVKPDNKMAVRNDWEKNDKIKNFKFQLRDKVATENEPVVCITSFNHQKGYAIGVLKDRRGMNEDEKRNFQNKWM